MIDGATPVEEEMRVALARLAPQLCGDACAITGLQRLSGGATQEIWRFAVGEDAFVLRRAPGGDRVMDGIGLENEARLMRAAERAGVPVAPVAHVLTPQDGLGSGFVMRFIAGETLGGRIVRSDALDGARRVLAAQCGRALALIHALDPVALPMLPAETPAQLLDRWYAVYRRSGTPRPVFEHAARWLRERMPGVSRVALVHGDFRNGNLMIGPDGIRAVLDWELAHLGDPMEDLGWLCVNSWRFGRSDLPVGGFGTREELYAGYEAAGGAAVDPEAAQWWEVFGTLRWGAMCAGSVAAFRGGDATLERAMIARRTSETEIDLMNLLAA